MYRFLAKALLIGAGVAISQATFAQAYPNKPVKIIVGYSPGGAADAGVRPLAKALEPLLGQPVLVDYKPGSAGAVAMDLISKTPADGYTLYFFDSGPLTVAHHLTKPSYNPFSAFTQLGQVCTAPSLLVTNTGVPFKSVAELIATAKREPAKWSFGTSGVGGPHHLSGEYFKSVTGIDLLHVPYKGGGPAMVDLMGGQIPMLFSSLAPAVGAVKSGKVKALAVTSLSRAAAFPDVPTLDELGFKGFESVAWFGLLGPAGLPADVTARLSQALQKISADKTVNDQIAATGCDPDYLNAAKTIEKIRADSVKWGKLIKDANIKAE